ncbi:DUF1232 domain-containing protein [Parabacteroides sp. W1-Q-101]|uniref:YkvA family protein n=1 Tax=Parabacteroides TaxID=375288 RepID=UPI00202F8C08|nr:MULTISPECIES: DUF1232 domain-containing protein [Parabacteroides]MCM0719986.1 DUF1232 domain-containing protein [Parabacteroides sp. W1-Q-101]
MDLISRFLRSDWIKKTAHYAYNPKRLRALVLRLGIYLSKKGPTRLKEQTKLLYSYLKDVSTGKYKDYHTNSLIFIIAAATYLITPVDFVPDMLPLGLMDDLMIISWVLNVTSDELKRYRLANKTDKNLSDSDKI